MKTNTFSLLFLTMLFLTPTVFAAKAEALLKGTAENSPITGKVEFLEANGEMKITVQVENVSEGKHGLHIHENGDCGDSGNAAGGHFNPDNVQHGLLTANSFTGAHAGDFGNIEVGANGKGKLEITIAGLTLVQGKYGITGKAVILHEKTDDFGQPTGNAGGRIACGIISKEEIAATPSPSASPAAESKKDKKEKK